MNTRSLRERAFEANRRLAATGLVLGTFGNVSECDRQAGVMAIKPSGVAYDALTPDQRSREGWRNSVIAAPRRAPDIVSTRSLMVSS